MPSFFLCTNISVDANIFPCDKVLESAKDSVGANIFVSAKVLDAPMFLYIFCGAYILCVFLHSYLVCASNLIGANVLRLSG